MDSIPRMGSHLMLDFTNITSIDLDNLTEVDKLLTKCILDCKATIVSTQYKQFEPQGVSILYLLSESHFSIHTWPESKSCAIDFYHCGPTARSRMEKAEEILCTFFGWENCSGSILIDRGGNRQALLNNYYHSSTLFKNLKLLHREKTEYQDLRVYESKEMGKILSLDGMIQITDHIDDNNFIDNYTVDLSRLIVQKGERYENLLIIGSGDMVIPNYLLKNKTFDIGKITVVEIDEKVFLNTKKYFKGLESIEEFVSAGKLEIIFADGAKYLKSMQQEGICFDGIIIDNSDVFIFEGPAASLFTNDFYMSINACLKKGASFSQQVSDETVKAKWENMVKSVGFREMSVIYTNAPEYSVALPIAAAKKT
jgi:spermidine synthase